MQNLILERSSSDHPGFVALVRLLDQELAVFDGKDHEFYARYNHIHAIPWVVMGFMDKQPVACGALKDLGNGTAEVKRMYTVVEQRGKNHAGVILHELETWARQLGFERLILETGKKQVSAIRLYQKSGYEVIPNYGQYVGVANSICFEKILEEKR